MDRNEGTGIHASDTADLGFNLLYENLPANYSGGAVVRPSDVFSMPNYFDEVGNNFGMYFENVLLE